MEETGDRASVGRRIAAIHQAICTLLALAIASLATKLLPSFNIDSGNSPSSRSKVTRGSKSPSYAGGG